MIYRGHELIGGEIMTWARTGAAAACLLLVLVSAPLAGDFEKGQEAFEHCDYSTAMSIWQALADKGNADAALRVANEYWSGLFVPEDRKEAAKWNGVALRTYRNLAEKGDPKAQLSLGSLYLEGRINVDYAEAMKWFHKAADQGNPRALYEMGEFYAWGWGVERDGNEALEWYRKAASTGDAWVQDNVGWMLASGQGAIKEDAKEAAIWFCRAADQDYSSAEVNLAGLYLEGRGVPKSIDEGLQWLKRAANHTVDDFPFIVSSAARKLGDVYRYGWWGVLPYGPEAVRWYRKAAELGDWMAAADLGDMYKEGARVPQDYPEAAKWYEKAAESNSAAGLVVGRLYRDGLGVPHQDYVLAYMWFNLAAPYLFGDTARRERDELSAKMTPEQINKAQQLTKERNPHCDFKNR
jgi:TPR repeat protein